VRLVEYHFRNEPQVMCRLHYNRSSNWRYFVMS